MMSRPGTTENLRSLAHAGSELTEVSQSTFVLGDGMLIWWTESLDLKGAERRLLCQFFCQSVPQSARQSDMTSVTDGRTDRRTMYLIWGPLCQVNQDIRRTDDVRRCDPVVIGGSWLGWRDGGERWRGHHVHCKFSMC